MFWIQIAIVVKHWVFKIIIFADFFLSFKKVFNLNKNSKAVEFKSSLAQSLAIIGVDYNCDLFTSYPPSSFDPAPLWNNKTKGIIYFILR